MQQKREEEEVTWKGIIESPWIEMNSKDLLLPNTSPSICAVEKLKQEVTWRSIIQSLRIELGCEDLLCLNESYAFNANENEKQEVI